MLADVRAPLIAIGPVQIENDVALLGGAGVDRLLHERAVGLAAIGLFRPFAEPTILRERQADDVHVPIFNGGVDRLENVPLPVAGPFQGGRIDAAEENGLAVAVKNIRADDFERGWGIGRNFRRPRTMNVQENQNRQAKETGRAL